MNHITRGIVFEAQPGTPIERAADESVAEFHRMIAAGEVGERAFPRAALIFNEKILRFYPETTADEVRAEYYRRAR